MKKHPLLIFLILLIGCKEISFEQPQPKGKKILKEVPEGLHGKYLIADENGKSTDTLTVDRFGYRLGHNPREKASLSDTLVLKFYKGYYFLNMNEHPEWILRVLRKEANGDLVYLAMEEDDKKFNSFLKRLSAKVTIDSAVVNGEKLYQIDPTPKKLVSLIKEGYFKQTVFKKIK
jgi:hypothetical protein